MVDQVLKGGIRNDNLLTLERAFSPDLTLTVVVNLACLNPFNANSDQGKIEKKNLIAQSSDRRTWRHAD